MNTNTAQFLQAISKIEQFSPVPRILGKAMALLRDSNSSIEDIVLLIKSDAALTAQIIRGANSAFYASTERVSSLDQAVQKIGFRESIRMLNLAAAQVISARGLDNYGITAQAFWVESLFNGLFAEALAQKTESYEPDEAYAAGLLRFIGRLAIDQSIEDLGSGLFWDGKGSLDVWEIENVGFTQAHAGAILLRKWQFPEPMAQAIEWQISPSIAPTPNRLAEVLHFTSSVMPPGTGGTLAKSTSGADEVITALEETEFVQRHNLTPEIVNELLAASRSNFDTVCNALRG